MLAGRTQNVAPTDVVELKQFGLQNNLLLPLREILLLLDGETQCVLLDLFLFFLLLVLVVHLLRKVREVEHCLGPVDVTEEVLSLELEGHVVGHGVH